MPAIFGPDPPFGDLELAHLIRTLWRHRPNVAPDGVSGRLILDGQSPPRTTIGNALISLNISGYLLPLSIKR